jgi:hypothetical protein
MKESKYKAIFFMGISFTAVGVVFLSAVNVALGIAFIAMGIFNMIIGLKHKESWK